MTLYLGNKPVCPARVVEKKVAKTKFGASIDTFIGDVDENGVLQAPETKKIVFDLSGVTKVGEQALFEVFTHSKSEIEIIANDVTSIGRNGFQSFANYSAKLTKAEFNGLESLTIGSEFYHFNGNGSSTLIPKFNKLKTVIGGNNFDNAFSNSTFEVDEAFPVLEYISGGKAFSDFKKIVSNASYTFSYVKTIIGENKYSSTFSSLYNRGTVWNFPRATELSDYVWNVSSSYPGEIHFAAANQAAIEASNKYSEKWGFAAAEIYFDLMLTITVNGVNYERKHTISGYTSWVSESGDIIYTDATAEPAAGTVVYSDQGTTQVGTVTEAA